MNIYVFILFVLLQFLFCFLENYYYYHYIYFQWTFSGTIIWQSLIIGDFGCLCFSAHCKCFILWLLLKMIFASMEKVLRSVLLQVGYSWVLLDSSNSAFLGENLLSLFWLDPRSSQRGSSTVYGLSVPAQ